MQEDYKTGATIQWTSKAVARENPSLQRDNLMKTGLNDNDSNAIRTDLIRGIKDPRYMTLEQMKACKEHAIARKRMYRCTQSEFRKDHLRQCLLKAEQGKNTEKCLGIRQKMVHGGTKKIWYCINRSQNDLYSPDPIVVTQMVNCMAEDSTSKEETEQFIFEETEQRFQLAANAPIETTE